MSDTPHKPYPTEPILGALDLSELACQMRLTSDHQERARMGYLALEDLDRAAGSIRVIDQPKIVTYYGSSHEKLLTAHGLFFLEPHGGHWYWATTQVPLSELCERFSAYADYFVDRSKRQLAMYRDDLAMYGDGGPNSTWLVDTISRLEGEVAAVEARRERNQVLPA